ncbi:LytTr DNA-binding domain-containing protein [Kordia periserrulae]|uniref:LytTr DNA-binding domain-containing protein n=1 Tax=Kordia periserrulae TaxID=701523 RepID=A0A2T6BZB3_9FLAO|nr:LytTR family DNA-binding domain-containing protein [Kordia periserrulae]PTX61386.1 LytTr DNA-binding domain-containing protein [Kordia periserrulae]
MTLSNIQYYFQQQHPLIDDTSYYRKLAIVVGMVLTIFVYIFDPYDNYVAIPKFEIPIKIIQLGYGINTTIVIYGLYWLLFRKLKFSTEHRTWKTYHHWLLLIAILALAGFIGTVYHRFMMDVGDVDTQYYVFVTIPRSIVIAIPLFVITLLLDRLYTSKNTIEASTVAISKSQDNASICESDKKIVLKSPVVNQCVELQPSQIAYIKASGNYVEIHSSETQKVQLLRASLRHVSERLSSYAFLVQCHRQYFVNIQKVQSYKGNSQRIVLQLEASKEQIPVSKSYVKKMLSYLKKQEKQ